MPLEGSQQRERALANLRIGRNALAKRTARARGMHIADSPVRKFCPQFAVVEQGKIPSSLPRDEFLHQHRRAARADISIRRLELFWRIGILRAAAGAHRATARELFGSPRLKHNRICCGNRQVARLFPTHHHHRLRRCHPKRRGQLRARVFVECSEQVLMIGQHQSSPRREENVAML